jgi:hypothetical protein
MRNTRLEDLQQMPTAPVLLKKAVGLLSSISATMALPAAAAAVHLQGVWQGTLGDQAIVACFNSAEGGSQVGSYFYQRHKQPIHLALAAGQDSWTEQADAGAALGDVSGHWNLGQPDEGGLKGSWSSVRGDRSLPIALKPLGDIHADDACGSDAYNAPLEEMPTVTVGKIQEINHHRYRTLRVADVEVVELLEHGPVFNQLNARFRSRLPTSKAALEQYFQTRRQFLGSEGVAASDEVHASVSAWTDKWLTTEDYRWAAGSGRQGISMVFNTWNLATGGSIDVRRWFGLEPTGEGDMSLLPEALQAWLDKTYPPGADCKDASYEGMGDFHMQLEPTGMHLYEEAFGNGCERDYTVSYAEIQRFLTPAGSAALKDLLGPHP